ncbi:hypothetical protein [Lactobacillus mulieris]|uniref:hypothetical protein n=1 Tax=Lactobacillus mulieris TaxID=2508708 RepID=UPI002244E998|nr:hypothetical protein [Lactobacillus mulieris]MCW8123439.1 hypothetical protein [Lactobacillus mulieris]MDK7326602.1 hypothetical protein [Lactobacillus mulieris]
MKKIKTIILIVSILINIILLVKLNDHSLKDGIYTYRTTQIKLKHYSDGYQVVELNKRGRVATDIGSNQDHAGRSNGVTVAFDK